MKSEYKRYTCVGVGGMKCKCCCSRGEKPTIKRQAKKRYAQAINKLIKSEV